MEIISETKEVNVKLQVDMTDIEIINMLNYYENNCPNSARTEMQVSWAIQDILQKRMNEEKKKLKKKKRK